MYVYVNVLRKQNFKWQLNYYLQIIILPIDNTLLENLQ